MIKRPRTKIDYEELKELRDEILNITDERYVKIDECNDTQKSVNKKLSNDDKRIEIISHDFGTIKKLMWAVASASIGSLVAEIFKLFF
jgi:septum formation topological specificity factor MinE